jgi:hypothetical protein
MEHTVTGISKMHVAVIELGLRLCQPNQGCADCTANDSWWMGLDVRYIYCSKCFFLFTLLQTFKQITLYKHVQVKYNKSVNCVIKIIFYSVCFFSIVTFWHYIKKSLPGC